MSTDDNLVPARKNEDGELVPADEPYTINGVTIHPDGTVESNSVDTDEQDITSEVLRARGQDGYLYRDYPVADYADVGEAFNIAASDLAPNGGIGEGGTIEVPGRNYFVQNRLDLRDAVKLEGENIRATQLKADSSFSQDAVVKYEIPSGESGYFGQIRDIQIHGNQSSVTTKGIYLSTAAGTTRDFHIDHVFVDKADEEGMLIDASWGLRMENVIIEHGSANATNAALDITPNQSHLSQIYLQSNDSPYAMYVGGSSKPSRFEDIFIGDNSNHGAILNNSDHQILANCIFFRNGTSSSNSYRHLEITGKNCRLVGCAFDGQGQTRQAIIFKDNGNWAVGCEFQGHVSRDVYVNGVADTRFDACHFHGDVLVASGSTDTAFHNCRLDGTISDNGTRTRWNGVIGAGPLGGVDLSATTGQFEGDRAMSSGATANTGDTAYSYWTWDATNSVWTDQDGNTV